MKAAGLLYTLGKTSLDKSEGDERNYELHVMLPSVGLAYNPKMRRVFHACTGIERLILDRVSNLSILLSHNYPKLKEIEAYVMEDVYVLELAQHYQTVQSVQLTFGSGCSVKRLAAAIKHVTDIKLVCDCDHIRDLFRLVREQPKITFIDVMLTKNIEVNLLANLDFFPNLKSISVQFAYGFGYGETFKNFLFTRGHMLELLTIDTDDFVDVPRLILDHSKEVNQLSCRFRLNSTQITKDQLEVIFKIPVRKEKVITFKALNSKQRKRIEKLVQQVQPKSVPYKMNVHVVTNDEFHVGAFDDSRI